MDGCGLAVSGLRGQRTFYLHAIDLRDGWEVLLKVFEGVRYAGLLHVTESCGEFDWVAGDFGRLIDVRGDMLRGCEGLAMVADG